MKLSTIIYSGLIAVAMNSCGNGNDAPENSGNNQVHPPVMNSGPQTEAERAKVAVAQDSTHTQATVGKDKEGANAKSTDSLKKR